MESRLSSLPGARYGSFFPTATRSEPWVGAWPSMGLVSLPRRLTPLARRAFLERCRFSSRRILFGGFQWYQSYFITNLPATAGTVVLAALPIILGTQFILAFLNFDTQNIPTHPLQQRGQRAYRLCDGESPADANYKNRAPCPSW